MENVGLQVIHQGIGGPPARLLVARGQLEVSGGETSVVTPGVGGTEKPTKATGSQGGRTCTSPS